MGRPLDRGVVDSARGYLAAWLRCEATSQQRPDDQRPQDLALYLTLLQNVAIQYADGQILDETGGFYVASDDTVQVTWRGKSYQTRVSKVLDHSGLATLLPTTDGRRRYRFEPVWIHRLMLETEPTTAKTAAVR